MIILLAAQQSIRDVILFPFMKPEKDEIQSTEKKEVKNG